MGREIVLVAGKDPLLELGGGHSAYVRAHARAALAAGYEPHLFGVGHRDEVRRTDYGVVHSLRSLWPLRRNPGVGSPSYVTLAPLHVPPLARAGPRERESPPGRTGSRRRGSRSRRA